MNTNILRTHLKKIPILGSLARAVVQRFRKRAERFSSERYWEQRYAAGGHSGAGSYGRLAEFKAEIINGLVREMDIQTVIEFGCGDGNQLSLASYPGYAGFDVSESAIARCRERFQSDSSKRFGLMSEYHGETADLVLSLDVIYHLVEDAVFERYMNCLFNAAERIVIIYSSDKSGEVTAHERPRKLSDWIAKNRSGWSLVKFIPNRYPFVSDGDNESQADFFVYGRGT